MKQKPFALVEKKVSNSFTFLTFQTKTHLRKTHLPKTPLKTTTMSLSSDSLPNPINIGDVVRDLHSRGCATGKVTKKKGVVANISLPEKKHVISEREFGSLWDFDRHGIAIADTFATYPGETNVHTISVEGPAIRVLRFEPGVEERDRFKPPPKDVENPPREMTDEYRRCCEESETTRDFILQRLRRHKCAIYNAVQTNTDDWFLFRFGKPVNEPDDNKLLDKMLQYNQFHVQSKNEEFLQRVNSGKRSTDEKLWVYPETFKDIAIPSCIDASGNPFSFADTVDVDPDNAPEEFVPESARNNIDQKFVVCEIITTPTLLNAVDESKFLRERNPLGPIGKNDYDEAVAVRLFRPFATLDGPGGAKEFKENFAKHSRLYSTIHVFPMYERVPLLGVFTEEHRKHTPTTYHTQILQNSIVERAKKAKIQRKIAAETGIELVHFGPEQTKAESDAQMEKLLSIGRAKEFIAKMTSMIALNETPGDDNDNRHDSAREGCAAPQSEHDAHTATNSSEGGGGKN